MFIKRTGITPTMESLIPVLQPIFITYLNQKISHKRGYLEATSWVRKPPQGHGEFHGLQSNSRNRLLYNVRNMEHVFVSTKRTADRKPLQKWVRTDAMQFNIFLSLFVHIQETPPLGILNAPKKKNKKSKAKYNKKNYVVVSTSERATWYDVVIALANFAARLSIEQIFRKDASWTEKKLKKLFEKGRSKTKTTDVKDRNGSFKRIIKLFLVKIYAQSAYCLLDTKSVPNFTSTTLEDRTGLTT